MSSGRAVLDLFEKGTKLFRRLHLRNQSLPKAFTPENHHSAHEGFSAETGEDARVQPIEAINATVIIKITIASYKF